MNLITRKEAAERLGGAVSEAWIGKHFHPIGSLEVFPGPNGKTLISEDVLPVLARRIKQIGKRSAALEALASAEIKKLQSGEDELKPIEPNGPAPPTAIGGKPAPMVMIDRPKKRASEVTEDDFNLFDYDGRIDPAQCRAWQEFEKAKKLQIERLATEGRYVEVEQVKPAVDRAMATIRKGVMGIPTKLKAVCHDLTIEQQSVLERLCREALEKVVIDYADPECE